MISACKALRPAIMVAYDYVNYLHLHLHTIVNVNVNTLLAISIVVSYDWVRTCKPWIWAIRCALTDSMCTDFGGRPQAHGRKHVFEF